jgi:hypothetical protein
MTLFILGLLWVTQPAYLRKKDIASMIAIVVVTKMCYFVDHEKSMNFNTDPVL